MRLRWGLPVLAAVIPLVGAGVAVAAAPGTGSITGTVTDQGGNRLPNICVDVSDSQGNLAGTETNTAGEYSFTGIPSNEPVTVEFHDCSNSNFTWQWYDGATTQADATPINVPDGGTASGIDATMQPGVSISGTVTDASSTALADVCVYVKDQQGSGRLSTNTDANGNYTAGGLQVGTYLVEFDASCNGTRTSNYQIQWFDNAGSQSQATPLIFDNPGETDTGVDATLPAVQGTPPSVTSLSPGSGPTSGGTWVTISGTNFTESPPHVWFGSTRAWHAVLKSSTEIDVVAPKEPAGVQDVTVTTAAGTSDETAADRFLYDASQPALVPSVTSVNPPTGPTTGGNFVTIDGENLGGTDTVMFGDVQSPVVLFISNSEIQAKAPAHDAGTVDITVNTSPLGPTANSPADRYTYDAGIAPVLPEAPVALLLPVAGIGAAAIVVRRRRRRALIHN